MSRLSRDATLLCVVVFLIAVTPQAFAQTNCWWDTGEDVACFCCPGFSNCVCADPGAVCPSSQQVCYLKNEIYSGFQEITLVTPQPCCSFRECQVLSGTTCTPVFNECVPSGE